MRTKLVAGNWKMNLTVTQGATLVETSLKTLHSRPDVDTVICAPYLALPRLRDILRNSDVKLGAQDVFWLESGAFTGKISPLMLAEMCVTFCIVGHSETRGRFGKLDVPASTVEFFGETDQTVNLKIKGLLYHAINPILCVGETLEEREAGRTDAVIERQIRGAFEGVEAAELYFAAIAYEPVWAIGTGQTCETAEANRVCGMIRGVLKAMYDDELAQEVRILYGGSVKSSNSKELFHQSEIDGGLIGGASLDPVEFAKIVMSA